MKENLSSALGPLGHNYSLICQSLKVLFKTKAIYFTEHSGFPRRQFSMIVWIFLFEILYLKVSLLWHPPISPTRWRPYTKGRWDRLGLLDWFIHLSKANILRECSVSLSEYSNSFRTSGIVQDHFSIQSSGLLRTKTTWTWILTNLVGDTLWYNPWAWVLLTVRASDMVPQESLIPRKWGEIWMREYTYMERDWTKYKEEEKKN